MSNGVIVHTNQISRMAGGAQKVLKDGSSVLVRVIADKGNGKYEGSVAGVRVNITSAKNLSVGSTFVASITTKNGTIYITPQNQEIAFENSFEISSVNFEKIANLLQTLNLPADNLSFNLLQQMKQLEMKLEPSLLGKIRNIAVKTSGKEKLVSELLTLLADKGILDDENLVLHLLAYLEGLDGDLEENSRDKESKELINKINKIDGGWFLIPFELIRLDMEEKIGSGVIRLLVDKSNQLKIVNLSCAYGKKKYLFNLEYEAKKLKTIRMNINQNDRIEEKIAGLKKLFANAGMNVEISWCEKEEIEGNACSTEEIYSIKGSV